MAIIKNPITVMSGGGKSVENGWYHFSQETGGTNWNTATNEKSLTVYKPNLQIENITIGGNTGFTGTTATASITRNSMPTFIGNKYKIIPTINNNNITITINNGLSTSYKYWLYIINCEYDIKLEDATFTQLQDGTYKLTVGANCPDLWRRNYYNHYADSYTLERSSSIGSTEISEYDLTNYTHELSNLVTGDILVKKVILPTNATALANSEFRYCKNLTEVSNGDSIADIRNNAFSSCTALTSLTFRNCINVYDDAFSYCTALTSINLEKATTISQRAFSSCTALTTIDLSNTTYIGSQAFMGCTALTSITLPKATSLATMAFYSCSGITTMTFGASQVCNLMSVNDIPASANQHITIYVPNDLISSYQTASNWITLYNNGYIDFQAIS